MNDKQHILLFIVIIHSALMGFAVVMTLGLGQRTQVLDNIEIICSRESYICQVERRG